MWLILKEVRSAAQNGKKHVQTVKAREARTVRPVAGAEVGVLSRLRNSSMLAGGREDAALQRDLCLRSRSELSLVRLDDPEYIFGGGLCD